MVKRDQKLRHNLLAVGGGDGSQLPVKWTD